MIKWIIATIGIIFCWEVGVNSNIKILEDKLKEAKDVSKGGKE